MPRLGGVDENADQEGAGEALKQGQRGWGVPINIFRFKEKKNTVYGNVLQIILDTGKLLGNHKAVTGTSSALPYRTFCEMMENILSFALYSHQPSMVLEALQSGQD